ncbi:nucleotidyltransferase [Candidatus Woesearchaeota archaeon]|nr:MAG: nucleotidyltransferase [Candidatus Woesearchaeota archaeon]
MQLIIPLAGKGTRLRPHTHTRPKPLVHVAGKPVLGHILDTLKGLGISHAAFITGSMEEQIKEFVSGHYDFKSSFVRQEELLGDGHAINLAREKVLEEKDNDVLIVFVDTIFRADFSSIGKHEADGIVWVKQVDDPKRFGIVSTDDSGFVREIIEKPEDPPTNLALIGLYYIKDKKLLFESLEKIISDKITSKGEYRLADALSWMIRQGKKIKAEEVDVWEDCGKPETLLSTNRHLLTETGGRHPKEGVENSVIVEPVYIEDGAEIKNSVIGPYVSIAKGARIENSVVKDSIINEDSVVRNATLEESLIGAEARVEYKRETLNIGDHSELKQK